MWTKEKRTNLRKQLAFNIDPEVLLGKWLGVSRKSVRIFESNNEILTNRIFSHYAWINSLPQKLEMKNLQTHQSPWSPWPHPTGIHPVADLNEISEPPQQNGSFSPSVVRPTKYKMQYIDIYILQYLSISSNRFLSVTFFWDSWVVFQLFQKFSDLHLRESMVFTGSWFRLGSNRKSPSKKGHDLQKQLKSLTNHGPLLDSTPVFEIKNYGTWLSSLSFLVVGCCCFCVFFPFLVNLQTRAP